MSYNLFSDCVCNNMHVVYSILRWCSSSKTWGLY